MTLQFIRQARLLVGSPGNPAKIGTPATPGTAPAGGGKTLKVAGQSYPVSADGTVTLPGAVYQSLPTDQTIPEIGYQGVTLNKDGTATLTGVSGSAVTDGSPGTPGTPNTPATPGKGLDLSQMRFRFSVTGRTVQTPKSLECRVYNLSRATANTIFKEFTRVRLTAGYAGNLGVIFDGTLTGPARIGRESQTETVLDITAAEADQAHNFAVVSTTLAAGSTPNDRLAALLKALEPYGITRGSVPDNLPGATLPRGCVLFGMVRDKMRDLAAQAGCDWSIKNDQLNMIPHGSYLPGPAIVLNSRTGMIGLPEQTSNGMVVRCLMNSNVVPGRPIHVDQKSVQQVKLGTSVSGQTQQGLIPKVAGDGFYRVILVSHEGDTRGEAWYTTATCVALADPVPTALLPREAVTPASFYDQQRGNTGG